MSALEGDLVYEFKSIVGKPYFSDQLKYNYMFKRSKVQNKLSSDMGFPTMWYVRPVKPLISLRIRAV